MQRFLGLRLNPFFSDCGQVFGLAWPVMLSRLGIVLMGIVDIAVVARFSLREAAFMTLAWAPVGVLVVAGIGLIQSVQVMASRALGEGEPARAGLAWQRGLAMALFSGGIGALALWFAPALFRILGQSPDLAAGAGLAARILGLSIIPHLLFLVGAFYLEAHQRPGLPLFFMIAANVLNLLLDLWLVFGGLGLPPLGAVGAAIATLLSRLFLAIGLLVAVWMTNGPGIRRAGHDDGRHLQQWQIGGAIALAQFFEVAAFNGMTIIAGWSGETAVAAYGIFINLLALVFMGVLGLSVATGVLVGRAFGAGDSPAMGRAFAAGLTLTAAFTVFSGLGIGAFGEAIVTIFTRDTALAATTLPLLGLMALAITPDGMQSTASIALRSRGDSVFPTVSHLFSYVCVMLPLGVLFSFVRDRGARGVVEAIIVGSTVSATILVCRAMFVFYGRRQGAGVVAEHQDA